MYRSSGFPAVDFDDTTPVRADNPRSINSTQFRTDLKNVHLFTFNIYTDSLLVSSRYAAKRIQCKKPKDYTFLDHKIVVNDVTFPLSSDDVTRRNETCVS